LKTANAALPASVAANAMALPNAARIAIHAKLLAASAVLLANVVVNARELLNAARIAIHARLLIANAPHAVNVKVLMNAVRTVIRELKSQDAAVRFCFRLCKN